MFNKLKTTSFIVKTIIFVGLLTILLAISNYIRLQSNLKNSLQLLNLEYVIEKEQLNLLATDFSGRWVIELSQPVRTEDLSKFGVYENDLDDDAHIKKSMLESGLSNRTMVGYHSYELSCDGCMFSILLKEADKKAFVSFFKN